MNSYYHHLGAVAAAPTPRPDQLRMVTLPSSLVDDIDEVAKARGLDRERLIVLTLTEMVERELVE